MSIKSRPTSLDLELSKRFDRTAALIGEDNVARLKSARVLVVGLGGVGGAAAETLARGGIGSLTVVDGDVFDETNLNRQILCTECDIGKNKAEVAKKRILGINREVSVTAISEFVTEYNAAALVSQGYSYCVDAIDDIKGKTALILACKAAGVPVISAMGAGNRIDCDFEITDLFKTKYDPFARAMRHALKDKIKSLDVACACSPPLVKSGTPASFAAPPLVMGALLANHVLKKSILL